jgi:hypothetical protein
MTTKFKLVETEEYLLAVSDEEVKLSNDNIGFFLRTHSISNSIGIIQNPPATVPKNSYTHFFIGQHGSHGVRKWL